MKHKCNFMELAPMPKEGRIRIFLVYQAGIANVFQVECHNLSSFGREAKRLYQGDFHTAEMIAYGMGLAGAIVQTAACNQAGDIINSNWTDDLENQPFSDKFCPIYFTIGT